MNSRPRRNELLFIKTLPEMLADQVQKRGESTALIYYGKKISYNDLWTLTLQTADLVCRAVPPDERVAIFMPNLPQFVFTYYGTLRAKRFSSIPVEHSLSYQGQERRQAIGPLARE